MTCYQNRGIREINFNLKDIFDQEFCDFSILEQFFYLVYYVCTQESYKIPIQMGYITSQVNLPTIHENLPLWIKKSWKMVLPIISDYVIL